MYGEFGHILQYSYLPKVAEIRPGVDSVANQNIRQGLIPN